VTTDPVLSVEGLRFAYGARTVLSNIDLTVGPGELVAILGPSGSGKSTLLRLIAGLERPAGGRIAIAGTTVADARSGLPAERRGLGLVFQEDALFPHLSVLDNVAFGLKGLPRSERRARALDALDRLGLADRADDWPHRLSGGEQQRVAVARALAPRPALILMDEPFSRLDPALRRQIREDVVAVLRDTGVGVVLVTHDAEEAMSSADRLVLMADGSVLQTGTPEACYHRPVSVEAGRLLGPLNVLPIEVRKEGVVTPFGRLTLDGSTTGAVDLAFRPEALVRSSDGVEARVISRIFAGAMTRYLLSVGSVRLEMKGFGADSELIEGQTVRVALRTEAAPTILSRDQP
jgi:iron(III) transport system ATP-binding protein